MTELKSKGFTEEEIDQLVNGLAVIRAIFDSFSLKEGEAISIKRTVDRVYLVVNDELKMDFPLKICTSPMQLPENKDVH